MRFKINMMFLVVAIVGAASLVALSLLILSPRSENDTPIESYVEIGHEPRTTPNWNKQTAAGDTTGNVLFVEAVDCGIADPAIDIASNLRGPKNFVLVSEIHAGLTRILHPTNEAVPAMAESFSVDGNGTIYDFRLRKDLKFSDGSPVTAVDIKWSWERALRKATETSRANDVLGSISGASEVGDSNGELAGVRAIDDLTLSVQLTHPRPDFPYLLADPIASVLKRGNLEAWAFEWDQDGTFSIHRGAHGRSEPPVGAGPFRLARYHPDQFATTCALERNEYYWGQPAQLDAIVPVTELSEKFGLITTKSIYTDAFIDERIDYYYDALVTATNPGGAEVDAPGVSIVAREPPRLQFLIFNPAHPPFDDVAFRRAIVAGTDRDSLYPYPVSTQGYLVPSSISGYDGLIDQLEFRPEFADREFDRSKYRDDAEEYTVRFNVSFSDDAVHNLIAQWKARFGFGVRLVGPGIENEYDGSIDPKSDAIKLLLITPHYPDPNAVLREFIAPFGEGNSVGELAILEEMIKKARSNQDTAERFAQYAEIERYISDQALAYPLRIDEYVSNMRVQPWIHGLIFPQYNASRYHSVWFDETAPSRELP